MKRKILFIGLGGVGQRHLRNFRTLLGEGLEALAYRVRGSQQCLGDDLRAESGRGLEEAFGVTAFRDLEEVLARKPEAAVIANPTALHLPAALACARAGCHLFIEKPLAHTEEGLDELRRVTRQAKRTVFVGYQFRFHPGLQALHRLLEEQAVGALLEARFEAGEYLPGWHPDEDYRTGYAARKDLGGGAALTQIHELDLALWFFGVPDRVFAAGGRSGVLEVDVEDTVSALLTFFREPERKLPVHIHLDYLQRPPVRRCEVVGTDGKITWDGLSHTLVIRRPDRKAPEVRRWEDFKRNEMFLRQAACFLECLEGRAVAPVDLEGGRRSLKMALAIKRSMETGQVIEWTTEPETSKNALT